MYSFATKFSQKMIVMGRNMCEEHHEITKGYLQQKVQLVGTNSCSNARIIYGSKLIFRLYTVGRGSSFGTATRYGLDGPEIESRWGRDFPHTSRPALRPIQPPVQWIPGLSRGVKRPERGVDHPSHPAPRLKKE